MIVKKHSKNRLGKAIFGWFFAIIGILSSLGAPVLVTNFAYAEPATEQTTTQVEEAPKEETPAEETVQEETKILRTESGETCEDALDELGWLICPTTGKIAQAVDWLYEKIEDLLVINPVEMKDGSPIYEIWKYSLGVANVVFIVFLLVVIYSQLTGAGITNYGIKKALPKLIVVAILVNLSFVMCSLAVDVSNVIGNGVRGVFTSIEEATMANTVMTDEAAMNARIMMADVENALAGGTAIATVGGLIGMESGSIWMLIPVVLGAVVAVASGLITIALRQAVVTFLIMVAPLAIVAYMLPNTEGLFKKWKDLFVKMLVFYPMFSLLFGASALAGYAIIAASNDGFGIILGLAVQIFPLFFSWSLMKMSGTILGTVNEKIRGFAAKPIAASRSWAESRKQSSAAKHLAQSDPYTPTLKLRQFLSNRTIARESEMKKNKELVSLRGEAYGVQRYYKRNGEISSRGERAYIRETNKIRYNNVIENSKADFEKGLGQLEVTRRSNNLKQRQRLEKIDIDIMNASDEAEAIAARMEHIKYDNARTRQDRMNAAMNAHMDSINGYYRFKDGNNIQVEMPRTDYKFHFNNEREFNEAMDRYRRMTGIMEGNAQETQYIMASAANSYDVQKKAYESKMQKLFENTVPTKDIEYRLDELSKNKEAIKNVDAIIAGMRVLNQRGDTDLVKRQLDQVLEQGVQLGTHASQSLASFLMFEVKDNDPFLRRFGKYINLETANMYNSNKRKLADVTYEEYVKGFHMEPDGSMMRAKKDMKTLVEGTSLDNVERTAFQNLDDSLMKAYGYNKDLQNGEWDVSGYLKRKNKIMTAFEPAFLSAMQKWQSGSEQINSGVKMWMGYQNEIKTDENGNVVLDDAGDPVYEAKPIWENNEALKGHEDEVKAFYRKKAIAFVEDQTVNQIQNMRTDVREALNAHLLEEYFGDEKKDPEGYKKRKAEFEKKKKEIMSQRHEGKTDDESKELNKKEWSKYYYSKIVGKPYRDILLRTGKLAQIERTSHSGGGNAMKDWNRIMIGLDDGSAAELINEDARKRAVENKRKEKQQLKEEQRKQMSDSGQQEEAIDRIGLQITDNVNSYRATFSDDVRRNMEEGSFYREADKYLANLFKGDHTIREKFFEYHRYHENATNYELYRELINLLSDPENYV